MTITTMVLMVIIPGTIAIALTVDIGAPWGILRRRWR